MPATLQEPTAERLRAMSLAELEQTYASGGEVVLPRGRFDGDLLLRLDNAGARHPLWRGLQALLFQVTSFGVDFDARRWFFAGRPHLAVGRFEAIVGPSRWRPTTAVRLHYEDDHGLPRAVRALLYDEVKPLSPTLCLGLGGINADRGRGDHFFFLLQRL